MNKALLVNSQQCSILLTN